MLYKAMMQTVHLCGSESWVITDAMMKMLEGLVNRISRKIAGKIAQSIRRGGGNASQRKRP